jgi:4-alpha-glucanotransferase
VAVAGVPPDYFSETGQLWGNPLYEWDVHRREGFSWWIERMKSALSKFDLIRVDHFRGIEAFWAVPAANRTAEGGRWMPGPRDELLGALDAALGKLPVVAEDLGFITPEVDGLREKFGLPGMRVLQFAFGGAVESRFLPHRFSTDILVTTGTHDNDTTMGWYKGLNQEELKALYAYVPDSKSDPVWALIRTAWSSVAALAMTPFQDLVEVGSEARINRPGIASGNWRWRATEKQLTDATWIERLGDYSRTYERVA